MQIRHSSLPLDAWLVGIIGCLQPNLPGQQHHSPCVLVWFGEGLCYKADPRQNCGRAETRQATVWHLIVRWKEEGLRYEADPRQYAKCVDELDFGGCKGCCLVPLHLRVLFQHCLRLLLRTLRHAMCFLDHASSVCDAICLIESVVCVQAVC